MKPKNEAKEYIYSKHDWVYFWLAIICGGSIKVIIDTTSRQTLIINGYVVGFVVGVLAVLGVLCLAIFLDSHKKYKVVGKRYVRTSFTERPMVEHYNETWKEED